MGIPQSVQQEHSKTESNSQPSGGSQSKKKVLLFSQWYPLTMAAYWRRAFSRRSDVDLKTCGAYTGTYIPWGGGMNLLSKYAIPPDIQMGGVESCNKLLSYSSIKFILDGLHWKPDLIVAVDAMSNWAEKPHAGCPVVSIGTDAHCLNYDHARKISDVFVNMHQHYAKGGDVILPYAFDPTVHFPTQNSKIFDCACVGMGYAHRTKLMQALRDRGLKVFYENGPVFDEYRELQTQAHIGINYASADDLNARVFELMAMKVCPVINYVPDLGNHFTDGVDYVGFFTIEEAVYKVEKLLECPQAMDSISQQAYDAVWEVSDDNYPLHSYDQRVHDLLKVVGLV